MLAGCSIRFVSLKELPDATFPGILRELVALDFPIVVNAQLTIPDQTKVLKGYKSRLRKMQAAQRDTPWRIPRQRRGASCGIAALQGAAGDHRQLDQDGQAESGHRDPDIETGRHAQRIRGSRAHSSTTAASSFSMPLAG